jgi:predicted aspartyl protease
MRALATVSAGFVVALGSMAVAAAPSDCKLMRVDEWAVRLERNLVLVDGAINGQTIRVMLDTGAMRSFVLRPAALRLGLPLRTTPYASFGAGGSSYYDIVQLNDFRIGQAVRKGWSVPASGENDPGAGIAFVLGEDFFSQVDVEFDLAHKSVRLFQPKGCDGVSLAYWASGDASEMPIERIDEFHPQIVLTILVNGQPVETLLDSGSSRSILTKSAAAKLGVTPDKPGVLATGKTTGLGPKVVESWMGPFDSVVIGNERISDTTIAFADLYNDSNAPRLRPMLLGTDFLLSHRVLVSHSQRKIYFTYAGGPVFQRIAPAKSTASGAEDEPSSKPDRN